MSSLPARLARLEASVGRRREAAVRTVDAALVAALAPHGICVPAEMVGRPQAEWLATVGDEDLALLERLAQAGGDEPCAP